MHRSPARTATSGENPRADKALGMDPGITRRDFLNASLLASGGLLLNPVSPAELLATKSDDDWTGYGGIGDYANSNGNTLRVLEAGHQIRDGLFENLPANVIDTGETYDFSIVGGGINGLAAAAILPPAGGGGKEWTRTSH